MLDSEMLGLEEGDIIKYLPTNQYGEISKIITEYEDIRYEVKLLSPDKKLRCTKDDLQLIIPIC